MRRESRLAVTVRVLLALGFALALFAAAHRANAEDKPWSDAPEGIHDAVEVDFGRFFCVVIIGEKARVGPRVLTSTCVLKPSRCWWKSVNACVGKGFPMAPKIRSFEIERKM